VHLQVRHSHLATIHLTVCLGFNNLCNSLQSGNRSFTLALRLSVFPGTVKGWRQFLLKTKFWPWGPGSHVAEHRRERQ
jgi:hypothetical protein